jgi:hypothetical protein
MVNKRVGSSIDVVEHLKAEIARKDAALKAVIEADNLPNRTDDQYFKAGIKMDEAVVLCVAALREEAP